MSSAHRSAHRGGPDRLPMPTRSELTPAQEQAVQAISAGPRGDIFGPFVPLLRSPEVMTALQEVGAGLRFAAALDRGVFEQAILQIARHWDQPFEWAYHLPIALAAGVPVEAAQSISVGEQPTDLPEPLATGWAVVEEVLATKGLSDAAYAHAVEVLGESGLIELVVTAGYYTTLAMVMNVGRTAVPAGELAVDLPTEAELTDSAPAADTS